MPLYEYQCDACGHRFEVIQKYSDAPISVCPQCGGAVQKLLSSPAIQFKGSGFYLTDYGRGTASKSDGASAKSAKTDGGSSGSADGAKSDGAKSDTVKSDGGSKTDAGSKADGGSKTSGESKPAAKAD